MAASAYVLDTSEIEGLQKAMYKATLSFNLEKLFDEIGVTEEGEIKERFETKKDPDGKSWESWSSGYAEKQRKQNKGGSLLMGPEARLQESISYRLKNGALEWGSPMIYARIHQEGGMAGVGRKVEIPSRPYLGIGESSSRMIGETLKDFIRRNGGGIL